MPKPIKQILKTRLTAFIQHKPRKPNRFHPANSELSYNCVLIGLQWARIKSNKNEFYRGFNFVFSNGTQTTYKPGGGGEMEDWILVQLKPHQYDEVSKIRVC